MTMHDIAFSEFAASDLEWLVEQHARLYSEDEGFDDTFGITVSRVLEDFLVHHDPCVECGWIVRRGQARLGSIFCMASGEDRIAKLRLFLLIPQARGMGLGSTLLEHALAFARSAGYGQVQVNTYSAHRTACMLYARRGFMCIRSVPARAFGRDLVQQRWELTF